MPLASPTCVTRKKPHPAALALASDGTLLINLAGDDHVEDLEAVLERARRSRARVFIGVPLTASEAGRVAARLEHSSAEAAALVFAARGKRRR